MRFANIERDCWHLLSFEADRQGHTRRKMIPDELSMGDSVKLSFEMELLDESNKAFRAVERMWVAVTEKIGEEYVGLLETEPRFPPDSDNSLIVQFMEVPFTREHVFEYLEREDEFRIWIMTLEPLRSWPKEYV